MIAGTCAGIAITTASTSACFNILIGCNTGCKICSGDKNIAIGLNAGRQVTTGSHNIMIGDCAGCKVTTGLYKQLLVVVLVIKYVQVI